MAASRILWWWGPSGKWWYPESCHWLHHELSAFTDKQWISCFLASLCCCLFSEPDWLVYCWLCKLPNIFSINCVSHQSICSLSVACNQNHDWYPEWSQEVGYSQWFPRRKKVRNRRMIATSKKNNMWSHFLVLIMNFFFYVSYVFLLKVEDVPKGLLERGTNGFIALEIQWELLTTWYQLFFLWYVQFQGIAKVGSGATVWLPWPPRGICSVDHGNNEENEIS